jgi:VanZ family protein
MPQVHCNGSAALTMTNSKMRFIFEITALVLLIAIVVLSLSPPLYRPVTILPHSVEHVTIFLATGLSFGIAFPRRRQLQFLSLPVFAGIIELCQLFVPGRHARLSDFVIDSVAVSLGVWVGFVISPRFPAEGQKL